MKEETFSLFQVSEPTNFNQAAVFVKLKKLCLELLSKSQQINDNAVVGLSEARK